MDIFRAFLTMTTTLYILASSATQYVATTLTGFNPQNKITTNTQAKAPQFTMVSASSEAPNLPILENFENTGEQFWQNWGGHRSDYVLGSGQVGGQSQYPIFWLKDNLSANQGASVKIIKIDNDTDDEFSIILKSQSNTDIDSGAAIMYKAGTNEISVITAKNGSVTKQGTIANTTLFEGDVLAAYSDQNGKISVYKNNQFVGDVSVTAWDDFSKGGYIGINVRGSSLKLDDFAGGNFDNSIYSNSLASQSIPAALAASTSVNIPTTKTLNVPLLQVSGGDSMLDANNWAIVWSGKISSGNNYFDARIVGADDGLRLRGQMLDKNIVQGESITFVIKGISKKSEIGNIGQFTYGERCGNSRLECRGWSVDSTGVSTAGGKEGVWSWADFGGKPSKGDIWTLEILRHDIDDGGAVSDSEWKGNIVWGERDEYYGTNPSEFQSVTQLIKEDTNIGGSTDCGAPDDPEYFSTWGKRNYENTSKDYFANIQAQWDAADWPCYAKYILKWDNPVLPQNAVITKAELMMYRFGHSGYGPGDSGTTRVRAFEIAEDWAEDSVSWDSAPAPRENLTYTDINECVNDCSIDAWRSLDVTEIVKRSLQENRSWSSTLLYTAAGQYHSGKYVFTREHSSLYPYVKLYYVVNNVPTAVPSATKTPTPTLAPSIAATPTSIINPTSTTAPTAPPATATPVPQNALNPVVLDAFNEKNGGISTKRWLGNVHGYRIENNALKLGGSKGILWRNKKYGSDQFAYLYVKNIGTVNSKTRFGVILKSQSFISTSDMVYVQYAPYSKTVEIWTRQGYTSKKVAEQANVIYAAGDILGARVNANGEVTVYKNSAPLITHSIKNSWTYYASEGWIGIMSQDSSGIYVDDFGTVQITSVTPLVPTATVGVPTSTTRPVVTIAPSVTVAITKTPTPTSRPQSTSTPYPTSSAGGSTYYISTTGSDSNNGASQSNAWKTFGRAWSTLMPGDTLMVLDGTYNESIAPNVRNGEPGKPIVIRAMNDGKVTIDGQGQRRPIQLGDSWGPNGGPIGNWYTVEGVVARNGSDTVVHVKGSNNTLRRISAYNADADLNSTVVLFWGDDNLIEDSIGAGSGRYIFEVFQGKRNTIRRVFAQWEKWDGRQFCGVQWPHGYNIGVYNANDTTVENAVAYGKAPAVGILVQANSDGVIAGNNAVLGSISAMSGRERDGSVSTYGTGLNQPSSRPAPSNCIDNVTQWSWGGQRVGVALTGQGSLPNNIFRDIIIANNVGVGFVTGKPYGIGDSNTTVDHITSYDNAASAEYWEKASGGNIFLGTSGVSSITNSRILGSQWVNGEGARLQNRYVNRQLTNDALLPLPMESRGQSELGISISGIADKYIQEAKNK